MFLNAQQGDYQYKNIRQRYRTEKIFVSDKERKKILQWMNNDLLQRELPETYDQCVAQKKPIKKKKVILDTDIGTDIDDALALLMLLHLPRDDYELLGITTTYGFTHIRAAIADKIVMAFAEQNNIANTIPIIPGESTPLGTHRPVWHTGTEGIGVLDEGEIKRLQSKADFVVANKIPLQPVPSCLDEAKRTKHHPAATWIIEQITKYPNEITIIALGPLTNIAIALQIHPLLSSLVYRLVFTGVNGRLRESDLPNVLPTRTPSHPIMSGTGLSWIHYPTHNVSSDTLAAVQVFQSGMPIDVVTNTLTTKLWFGQTTSYRHRELAEARNACLTLLASSKPKENVVVMKLLHEWLRYRSLIFQRDIKGTCPHDALTVAEAIYPDRFVQFNEPGQLMIHEWAGFATFVFDKHGLHRLGRTVEADNFLRFFSETLMGI